MSTASDNDGDSTSSSVSSTSLLVSSSSSSPRYGWSQVQDILDASSSSCDDNSASNTKDSLQSAYNKEMSLAMSDLTPSQKQQLVGILLPKHEFQRSDSEEVGMDDFEGLFAPPGLINSHLSPNKSPVKRRVVGGNRMGVRSPAVKSPAVKTKMGLRLQQQVSPVAAGSRQKKPHQQQHHQFQKQQQSSKAIGSFGSPLSIEDLIKTEWGQPQPQQSQQQHMEQQQIKSKKRRKQSSSSRKKSTQQVQVNQQLELKSSTNSSQNIQSNSFQLSTRSRDTTLFSQEVQETFQSVQNTLDAALIDLDSMQHRHTQQIVVESDGEYETNGYEMNETVDSSQLNQSRDTTFQFSQEVQETFQSVQNHTEQEMVTSDGEYDMNQTNYSHLSTPKDTRFSQEVQETFQSVQNTLDKALDDLEFTPQQRHTQQVSDGEYEMDETVDYHLSMDQEEVALALDFDMVANEEEWHDAVEGWGGFAMKGHVEGNVFDEGVDGDEFNEEHYGVADETLIGTECLESGHVNLDEVQEMRGQDVPFTTGNVEVEMLHYLTPNNTLPVPLSHPVHPVAASQGHLGDHTPSFMTPLDLPEPSNNALPKPLPHPVHPNIASAEDAESESILNDTIDSSQPNLSIPIPTSLPFRPNVSAFEESANIVKYELASDLDTTIDSSQPNIPVPIPSPLPIHPAMNNEEEDLKPSSSLPVPLPQPIKPDTSSSTSSKASMFKIPRFPPQDRINDGRSNKKFFSIGSRSKVHPMNMTDKPPKVTDAPPNVPNVNLKPRDSLKSAVKATLFKRTNSFDDQSAPKHPEQQGKPPARKRSSSDVGNSVFDRLYCDAAHRQDHTSCSKCSTRIEIASSFDSHDGPRSIASQRSSRRRKPKFFIGSDSTKLEGPSSPSSSVRSSASRRRMEYDAKLRARSRTAKLEKREEVKLKVEQMPPLQGEDEKQPLFDAQVEVSSDVQVETTTSDAQGECPETLKESESPQNQVAEQINLTAEEISDVIDLASESFDHSHTIYDEDYAAVAEAEADESCEFEEIERLCCSDVEKGQTAEAVGSMNEEVNEILSLCADGCMLAEKDDLFYDAMDFVGATPVQKVLYQDDYEEVAAKEIEESRLFQEDELHCSDLSLFEDALENILTPIRPSQGTIVAQESDVITIQRFVKGYFAQKMMISRHRAASLIQKSYRQHQMDLTDVEGCGNLQSDLYYSVQRLQEMLEEESRSKSQNETQKQNYLDYYNDLMSLFNSKIREMNMNQEHHRATNAAKIQSCISMMHVKKDYQQLHRSLKTLQKKIREEHAEALDTSYEIARYYRGHIGIISLQSRFRASRVRRQFNSMQVNLIKLQAWARMEIQMKKYQTQVAAIRQFKLSQSSATTIQSWARMKMSCSRYRTVKSSIVMLQRLSRSVFLRQSCAVRIQANLRGSLQRQKFATISKGVLRLQAHVRRILVRAQVMELNHAVEVVQSFTLMIIAKRRLCCIKVGVTTLQAVLRGVKARRFVKTARAATKIESYVRCKQKRTRFVGLRRSVVVLERYCRARFNKKQSSATKIQVLIRGALQRQKYYVMGIGFVKLQAHIHGMMIRKRVKGLIGAIKVIQSFAFMIIAKKRFCCIIYGVTKLQASFRGGVARNLVSTLRATIKLQSFARFAAKCSQHTQLRASVIILQRRCRLRTLMRQSSATRIQAAVRDALQCQKYCIMRRGFIRLQALERGILVRKQSRVVKEASITIQSFARMVCETKILHLMTVSVILVQAVVRGSIVRRSHFRRITLIVQAQAVFRGALQRQNYLRIVAGIVLIQANIRAHIAVVRMRSTMLKVIRLQSLFRGKNAKAQYVRTIAGVIVLQRWVRHLLEKKALILHEAAVKIQSQARTFLQLLRRWSIKIHVVRLQSFFRGKIAKEQYLRTIAGVIMLQQSVRQLLQRKYLAMEKAAVIIQSNSRTLSHIRHYTKLRKAPVTIQRYFRGMLSRSLILRQHTCAQCIQRTARASMQRRKFLSTLSGTISLQARVRGVQQKRFYCSILDGIVIVQSFLRSAYQRRRYRCVVVGLTLLQARIKGRKCRFSVLKANIISLQAHARGMVVRAHSRRLNHKVKTLQDFARMAAEKKRNHHTIASLIALQSAVRGHNVRRSHFQARAIYFNIRRSRVVKIQAVARGAVQRQNYRRVIADIVRLQAHLRARIALMRMRSVKIHVVRLQSFFRGKIAKKQYLRTIAGVIMLQQALRQLLQRKRVMHKAAVMIQSNTRTLFHICHYTMMRIAPVTIQRYFRGMLIRSLILRQHTCAQCIQRTARASMQRRKYLRIRSGTISLQARVRCMQQKRVYHSVLDAIVTVQSFLRSAYEQRRYRCVVVGLTSLQAQVRGKQNRLLLCSKVVANVAWNDLVIVPGNEAHLTASFNPPSDCSNSANDAALMIQKIWRAFCAKIEVAKKLLLSWTMDCYYPSHIENKMSFLRAGILVLKEANKGNNVLDHVVSVVRKSSHIAVRWRRAMTVDLSSAFGRRTGTLNSEVTLVVKFKRRRTKTFFKSNEYFIRATHLHALTRENQSLESKSREFILKFIQDSLAKTRHQRCQELAHQSGAIKIQRLWKSYLLVVSTQNQHHSLLSAPSSRSNHLKRICHGCILLQAAIRGFLLRYHRKTLSLKALLIQRTWALYRSRPKLNAESPTHHYLSILAFQRKWRDQRYSNTESPESVVSTSTESLSPPSSPQQSGKSKCPSQSINFACLNTEDENHAQQQHTEADSKSSSVSQSLSLPTIIKVQSFVRMKLGCERYINLRRNVVKCQAFVRGVIAKKPFTQMEAAVVKIQAKVRCWSALEYFKMMKFSAVAIQSWARSISYQVQFSRLIDEMLNLNSSAQTIQMAWYKYKTNLPSKSVQFEKQMPLLHRGIISLLRKWRSSREQSRRVDARRKLKSFIRLWIERREIDRAIRESVRKNDAASKLQCYARGLAVRSSMKLANHSASTIQQCYFKYLERRREELNTLRVSYTTDLGLQRENSATIVLQSCIRMWRCQRDALSMKSSVINIQRYWKERQRAIQEENSRRELAVRKLQSQARVLAVSCRMKSANYSASKIQRYFLQHMQRSKQEQIDLRIAYVEGLRVQRKQSAAIVLQSIARMWSIRQEILCRTTCAIKIQRHFRLQVGTIIYRRRYEKLRRGIIGLQALIRGVNSRVKYYIIYAATIKIQSLVRCMLTRQAIVPTYRNEGLHLLTKLQARFRCYNQHSHFIDLRNGMIQLQAIIRGSKTRLVYHNARASIILIQSMIRGAFARGSYKNVISKVQFIQAFTRGRQQRVAFVITLDAAIRIQSFSRLFIKRSSYKAVKRVNLMPNLSSSAKSIQMAWRKYKTSLPSKSVQFEHQTTLLHRGVISLQRKWRSSREQSRRVDAQRKLKAFIRLWIEKREIIDRATQEIVRKNDVALKLQCYARGLAVRSSMKAVNHSASTIQQCYFKYLEGRRKELVAMRAAYTMDLRLYRENSATIVLQRAVRKFKTLTNARKQLEADSDREEMAAKKIQSIVRTWLRFLPERELISAIDLVKATHTYEHYTPSKLSAPEFHSLQSPSCETKTAISLSSPVNILEVEHRKKVAAQRIQKVARGWLFRSRYLSHNASAFKIQHWYRIRRAVDMSNETLFYSAQSSVACLVRIQKKQILDKQEVLIQNESSITIQAIIRKYAITIKIIRLHKNALVIQRMWRSRVKAKSITIDYQSYCQRISTFQALCKCKYTSSNLIDYDSAAICIQSAWRGMLVRKHRNMIANAVICIQDAWTLNREVNHKFFLSNILFNESMGRMLKLQAKCRFVWGPCVQNIILNRRIGIFQVIWRGSRERKQLSRANEAAKVIQKCWSRFSVSTEKNQSHHQYQTHMLQIVLFQRLYKSLRAESAVLTIQRCIRTHIANRQYSLMISSAKVIQAVIRMYSAKQIVRHSLTQRHSAICLQSFFRALTVRLQVKKRSTAASIIQRRFRVVKVCYGLNNNDSYGCFVGSIITLQKSFKRGFRVRSEAAKKVQVLYFSWKMRLSLAKVLGSVVQVQKTARGYISRLRMQRRDRSALVLQRSFRRYLDDLDGSLNDESDYSSDQVPTSDSDIDSETLSESATTSLAPSLNETVDEARQSIQDGKDATSEKVMNDSALLLQRFFKRITLKPTHKLEYSLRSVVQVQKTARGYLSRLRMQRRDRSALLLQRSFRRYLDDLDASLHNESDYSSDQVSTSDSGIDSETLSDSDTTSLAPSLNETLEEDRGSIQDDKDGASKKMNDSALLLQRFFKLITQKPTGDSPVSLSQSQAESRDTDCKLHIMENVDCIDSFVDCTEEINSPIPKKEREVSSEHFDQVNVISSDETANEPEANYPLEATILLQCIVRGASVRKCKHHFVANSIIIQQAWRSYKLSKTHISDCPPDSDLKLFEDIVILLQYKWRRCASGVLRKDISAIKIQSLVRLWLSRNAFCLMRKSARKIQQSYRSHTLRKSVHIATLLQSTVRAWRCRHKLSLYSQNVSKLQRCARKFMHKSRKEHMAKKNQYENELRVCRETSAAAIISSAVGYWLWKRSSQRERAAVKIQSIARMGFASNCFSSLKGSLFPMAVIKEDCATRKIQRLYRQRSNIKNSEFATLRAKCIKIQSSLRRHQSIRVLRRHLAKIVVLQCWARMKAAKSLRTVEMNKASQVQNINAITLQRFVRGHLMRNSLHTIDRAARIIQRAQKRSVSRLRAKLLKVFHLQSSSANSRPVVRRQSSALLPKDKQKLNRIQEIVPHLPCENGVFVEVILNSVAVVIQSSARRYIVMKEYHHSKTQLISCAVCIQRIFRGSNSRKKTSIRHSSASTLQAFLRRYQTRKLENGGEKPEADFASSGFYQSPRFSTNDENLVLLEQIYQQAQAQAQAETDFESICVSQCAQRSLMVTEQKLLFENKHNTRL